MNDWRLLVQILCQVCIAGILGINMMTNLREALEEETVDKRYYKVTAAMATGAVAYSIAYGAGLFSKLLGGY